MRNTEPRATASGWPVLVGGEYEAASTDMGAGSGHSLQEPGPYTRAPRVDVLYLHGCQSAYPCPAPLVGPRGLGQNM